MQADTGQIGADASGKGGKRRRRSRAKLDLGLTLASLDHRTAAAQAVRQVMAQLERDLGGDLSAAQQQLVQRASVLGAFIEGCESKWLRGEEVDPATWLAATNVQRRLLVSLGLERRARDVEVPRLREYLEQRHDHD
jgi:hypothetical protein